MSKDLQKVQDFIFDYKVQTTLSNINNHLMSFNILEITGMGTQEIKHSNILGWFFDASEHNLEYQILNEFLRKVIQKNPEVDATRGLQEYLYLAKHKKDISIYREKDNIDLLIVDNANNVIIVFENKLYASERKDGDDGGQLTKYENIINTKYKSKLQDPDNGYDKYFIFLTKDLEEPEKGEEYWLRAEHQYVTDVLGNILKTKDDLSEKTKIIFESYIDLLKRSGIVKDDALKKLCKEIWANKEYREAFEIILNNKPHRYDELISYIKSFEGAKILKEASNGNIKNIFVSLNDVSPFVYRFIYNKQNLDLAFVVVSKKQELRYTSMTVNEKTLTMTPTYLKNPKKQLGYYMVSRSLSEYNNFMIQDKDLNEKKIHEILKVAQDHDENYIQSLSKHKAIP